MNPEHTPPPPETPDITDFLTPREVADLLHVTPKTVARWAKAGKIGSTTTLGGHRRSLRADINTILCPRHNVEPGKH